MLFKRHHKPHPIRRLHNFFWPRSGWRRSFKYLFHRVGRLQDTPHGIAAGFASGAAISFTPFMGFHFVGAALLAWLTGGNLLASAIGTVLGNPWTFPFIWYWIYHFGNWILQNTPAQGAPEALTIQLIFQHPGWLLWPMTVGGIPTAIVAWFAFYWPIKKTVASYKRHRHLRREKGRHRRAAHSKTKKQTRADE